MKSIYSRMEKTLHQRRDEIGHKKYVHRTSRGVKQPKKTLIRTKMATFYGHHAHMRHYVNAQICVGLQMCSTILCLFYFNYIYKFIYVLYT